MATATRPTGQAPAGGVTARARHVKAAASKRQNTAGGSPDDLAAAIAALADTSSRRQSVIDELQSLVLAIIDDGDQHAMVC